MNEHVDRVTDVGAWCRSRKARISIHWLKSRKVFMVEACIKHHPLAGHEKPTNRYKQEDADLTVAMGRLIDLVNAALKMEAQEV